MFQTFFDRSLPTLGSSSSPLATTVMRRYSTIDRLLKDYHSRSSLTLNNDHILVQLLRSMDFRLGTPLEDVVGACYARGPYVGKHFGLTSSISEGRPFYKTFYSGGTGYPEYILNEPMVDIDPFGDSEEWRHLNPFRVLYHSNTDFHFLLPKGGTMPYLGGFSVIQIDLVLLVLQYQQYKKEQLSKGSESASTSPSSFLVREALPKLFEGGFCVTIMNNALSESGWIVDSGIPYPPVSLPDMTTQLKVICKEINQRTKKRGIDYQRALENIPLPLYGNGKAFMQLPRIPLTSQVHWLLWLCRFTYIQRLIELGGRRGIASNRGHISQLKSDLSQVMANKAYLRFKSGTLESAFKQFEEMVRRA